MSTSDLSPYSFEQTIAEAELVLANASERGIEVPANDIDAILKVVRSDPKGQPRVQPADEAAFWAAFARANRAIAPLTVQSLKAINEHVSTRPFLFGGRAQVPRAREAVDRYRRWALLVVLMLVLVQTYATVGGALLRSIDELHKLGANIEATINKRKAELGTKAAIDDDLNAFKAEKNANMEQLEAVYGLVGRWNRTWNVGLFPLQRLRAAFACLIERWAPCESGATDEAAPTRGSQDLADGALAESDQRTHAEPAEPMEHSPERKGDGEDEDLSGSEERVASPADSKAMAIRAQVALSTVEGSLLPLFYGWLGACAYILRRLGNEITSGTFSGTSEFTYRLRMPLGALAGMAIGWFLQPVDSQSGVGNVFVRSLSAPALAFLAGYSVELLFAVMDAVISALSVPAGTK